MDLHVFSIPIPPPASLSIPSLWVRALFSCIQPGLVICSPLIVYLFHAILLRFSCRTHVPWGLRKATSTLPVNPLLLSSFFDPLGLPHSLWGLFNIPPLKSHSTSSRVPPQTQKSCQALCFIVCGPQWLSW